MSISRMDKRRAETSHELTCFQPLSPEPTPSSAGFLWKLFFGRAANREPDPTSVSASWKKLTLEQTQEGHKNPRQDPAHIKEKTTSVIPTSNRPNPWNSRGTNEMTPPKRTLQTVLLTIGKMVDVQVYRHEPRVSKMSRAGQESSSYMCGRGFHFFASSTDMENRVY